MPFDLASAKPAGFDLASATPVPPGKEKSGDAAPHDFFSWDNLRDLGNEAVRATSGAITGLPTMVADVPVAATNLIRGRDKSGKYPYELPSVSQQRRLDAGFAPPTSTAGKVSEAATSILMGGGAGAGRKAAGFLTPAERAAQALPKPLKAVAPEVRTLADKGVTMTPGDIKGGSYRNIEDKLTSLPIIGNMIKNAKGRSVAQFQEATVNDALKEIGKRNPKGVSGHEAIRQAKEKFTAAYDRILPNMKGSLDSQAPGGATPSFRRQLDLIKQMVGSSSLKAEQKETVNRILDEDIIAKFQPQGQTSGKTLQEIKEELRLHIEDYQQSTNPGDRKIGKSIEFAQEAMEDMMERENPRLAGQYKQLRNGYAQYKIAERAAGYKGAKEGVPSASQYMGAVRAQDKSNSHSAFATGTARQQKLGEAGENVLGNREPDSGTGGRVAAMDMLAGGTSLLKNPLLAGAYLSAPFIYSQTGLRGLQMFLLGGGKRGAGLATGALQGAALAAPGSVDQNGVGQ